MSHTHRYNRWSRRSHARDGNCNKYSRGCMNCGSCDYCRSDRTHHNRKRALKAQQSIEDYYNDQ